LYDNRATGTQAMFKVSGTAADESDAVYATDLIF